MSSPAKPPPHARRLPSRAELQRRRDLLVARSALDRGSLALQLRAVDQTVSQRLSRVGHWLRVARSARRASAVLALVLPALLVSRAGRHGLSQGARRGARLVRGLLKALPAALPIMLRVAPWVLRWWRQRPPGQTAP